ncbi:MAG: hypothetical protein JNL70_16300 [Saprospiraceae bacterium]|nr:hypothetical protein [Saprospiraceae bacterium]
MKYLDSAKSAIQEGEPERAITLLREYLGNIKLESNKIVEDLILLGSRYSVLKNSKQRDLITFEMEIQELNKINLSLLEVIEELELKSPESSLMNFLDSKLLMNMPKNAISDTLYYGFLITGIGVGFSFLATFFTVFYNYIHEKQSSVIQLLFIGSLGVLASCFLMGAYEGLNRRNGMLVNWKIIAPHLIVATLMLIAAAVLTLTT